MLRSVRLKLVAALLGMSVLSIVAVGGIARWKTMERFDEIVDDRAFEGFQSEIVEYYTTYGSFEAANAAEPFHRFVDRTRPSARRGTRATPPPRPGEGSRRPPRPGDRAGAEGEPPPRPAARRSLVMGGTPPPFVLVDDEGVVLLELAGFDIGERVDPDLMRGARPVMIEDTPIAQAIAFDRPDLTNWEERFRDAVQDAWVFSLLLAALLALPVGALLGRWFATPVTELTGAIDRMRDGQLKQELPVRSADELGHLTVAFNTMSEELSEAYAELEDSRAQLADQAEWLRDLSRRDDLTGLGNRRAFDEQLSVLAAQAKRYGRPLTVALADVDHFKRVNDDFSHQTGDDVLKQVADVIAGSVREVDVAARYGGEEFAVAFPETDLKGATHLAERLREAVAAHRWSSIEADLSVTLSIGIATVDHDATIEAALAHADRKLYEAKAAGRNRVHG